MSLTSSFRGLGRDSFTMDAPAAETVVLETKPKRVYKPRKKKAQLIEEARDEGYAAGISDSTGSLAMLVVGAGSGVIGTLIFLALYHAMHG